MKNHFSIFKTFMVLALVFSLQSVSFSQPPPPPTVPHGTAGNQGAGGGAPIGDGMFLLIGLAGLYGGKKMLDYKQSVKSKQL